MAEGFTEQTVTSNENTTEFVFKPPESPLDETYILVLMVTSYSVVSACCIVGNALVIFVILIQKKMRSSTTFFLSNLALADVCVGIFCVMPTLIQSIYPEWLLGRIMCKLHYFVRTMSYTSSITFLTVISLERYMAVVRPMLNRRLSRMSLLRKVAALVWLSSAIYAFPILLFYDVVRPDPNNHETYCVCKKRMNTVVYILMDFALWYVAPLCLMVVVYSKISLKLWDSSLSCVAQSRGESTHPRHFITLQQKIRNKDSVVDNCCSCCCFVCSCFKREGRPQEFEMKSREKNSACSVPLFPSPSIQLQVVTPDGVISKLAATSGECELTTEAGPRGNSFRDNGVQRPADKTRKPNTQCSRIRAGAKKSEKTKTLEGLRVNYSRLKTTGSKSSAVKHNPLMMRRKVMRLLMAVIATFALCVLPDHVRLLWQTFNRSKTYHPIHLLIPPITSLIFYLNNCLNPLLYALLSENFRRGLRGLFCCARAKRSSPVTTQHSRAHLSIDITNKTCHLIT